MATKKQTKPKQDDLASALMKKGSLTITAESREALYAKGQELLKQLPADAVWTRGMVEHLDGSFLQTYSLIKK